MTHVTDACHQETTDAQLMQRFYEGDARAFDALVQRLAASLFGQAYTQLPTCLIGRRQIAEDLVQQTFMKAVITRDRPATQWRRTKGAVRTWLGTILRNALISYLRKRVSKETAISDFGRENDDGNSQPPESRLVDHRVQSEMAAIEAEAHRQVQLEAISRLPEKTRSILYMKIEGLSHQQIARQLGLSKSTITYHFREAKRTLRATDAVAA